MQAAALERVGYVAGVVGGQEHDGRRAGGGNGADLGHGDLIVREHFQQQGFEFLVGLVDFVEQQHAAARLAQGLEQGTGFQEFLGEEDIVIAVQLGHRLAQPAGTAQCIVDLVLEHLDIEQLLAVFPFVERLGLVQAFVALQTNQRQFEHGGHGLGQLGLAYAGRALHEYRLLQLRGQIDHGRDPVRADIAVCSERVADGINAGENVGRRVNRRVGHDGSEGKTQAGGHHSDVRLGHQRVVGFLVGTNAG